MSLHPFPYTSLLDKLIVSSWLAGVSLREIARKKSISDRVFVRYCFIYHELDKQEKEKEHEHEH